MKREHGPDVAVLENRAAARPRSAYDGIHHSPGQVVGLNHLVGQQQPNRRIDLAQQAVTEVRFLARLQGIAVRRPGKCKCEGTPPRAGITPDN